VQRNQGADSNTDGCDLSIEALASSADRSVTSGIPAHPQLIPHVLREARYDFVASSVVGLGRFGRRYAFEVQAELPALAELLGQHAVHDAVGAASG
jgi:hypothetical protein